MKFKIQIAPDELVLILQEYVLKEEIRFILVNNLLRKSRKIKG